MKKTYRVFPFLIFATAIATVVTAQDVAFSQYYDQPFQRNPALAGIFTGDVRAIASFRNQWQSVTVPYRTFGLSGELKMPMDAIVGDNLTIGLQLIGDVAGTSRYRTNQVMPAINYSLPLSQQSNSYLSLGFMGGLREQSFDPAMLVLNDQVVTGPNGTFSISPASSQVFGKTTNRNFDLSAGLSYNGAIQNVDYYIGAGMFHITSPQIGYFDQYKVSLHKKLAVNFGLAAPLGEEDQLRVYGDYFTQYNDKYQRIGINSIQAGLMFNHNLYFFGDEQKSVTLGALYRFQDAIIPVIKLELIKLAVGVSYDVNISKLRSASYSRGGFEFTLSYRGFLNYRNSDLRQTSCPRFGRG